MQKLIPVALLAILLVGCKGGDSTAAGGTTTGGSTSSGDKTYTLKLNPKEGDKFDYTMNMDAAGQKMEMEMSMVCDKAEADKYTLTMSVGNVKMNGAEAPAAVAEAMKKAKTTMVMDSTGKTLEVKSEGGAQGGSFSGASLPTKPVKVGDEWEATSNVGGKDMTAKYKFARVENEGGKEIAVFEVTTTGMEGATLEGPITYKVDTSNGMTYGMSMKAKGKGPDGKEMISSVEMKQK